MKLGKLTPPPLPEATEMERKFREELAKRASQSKLPELTADPTTSAEGDVWILFSGGNYQLSYKTVAGTIKRVTLT